MLTEESWLKIFDEDSCANACGAVKIVIILSEVINNVEIFSFIFLSYFLDN